MIKLLTVGELEVVIIKIRIIIRKIMSKNNRLAGSLKIQYFSI
jgi:hypothetical protein